MDGVAECTHTEVYKGALIFILVRGFSGGGGEGTG